MPVAGPCIAEEQKGVCCDVWWLPTHHCVFVILLLVHWSKSVCFSVVYREKNGCERVFLVSCRCACMQVNFGCQLFVHRMTHVGVNNTCHKLVTFTLPSAASVSRSPPHGGGGREHCYVCRVMVT